jgi:hypothetical protein
MSREGNLSTLVQQQQQQLGNELNINNNRHSNPSAPSQSSSSQHLPHGTKDDAARRTATSTNTTVATLKATILSVYDLPYREPPSYVSVSVLQYPAVCTGPPSQRHRDRNSFKFGSVGTTSSSTAAAPTAGAADGTATRNDTNALPLHHHDNTNHSNHNNNNNSNTTNSSRVLTIAHSPLSELYRAVATVQLVYTNSHTSSSSSTSSSSHLHPVTSTITTTTLSASYPLHQLKIHETSWVILQLQPPQSQSYATNMVTGTTSGVQHGRPVVTSSSSSLPHNNNATTATTKTATSTTTSEMEDHDELEDLQPPTIRLQLTLSGPYRPEIRALLHAGQVWFHGVDQMEQMLYTHVVRHVPKLPFPTTPVVDVRFLLIPLAPILAVLVVVSPILVGASVITLPLFLPLLVVLFGMITVLVSVLTILYFSSSSSYGGRSQMIRSLQPVLQTILSTKIGQSIVYDIGPRCTPVSFCRQYIVPSSKRRRTPQLPQPTCMIQQLIWSLCIDAMGSASYLLPVAGEMFDIGWAPVQTILIMAMYVPPVDDDEEEDAYPITTTDDSTTTTTRMSSQQRTTTTTTWYTILPYLSFLEEILPLTDIIPTATMSWLVEYGLPILISKLSFLSGS